MSFHTFHISSLIDDIQLQHLVNVFFIVFFLNNYKYFRKTFKRIIKKKSTEDFKGIPYITTLLSTSLWTFYGLLKPGGLLVVTVNGTGALLHILYVTLFLIYAPKTLKVNGVYIYIIFLFSLIPFHFLIIFFKVNKLKV